MLKSQAQLPTPQGSGGGNPTAFLINALQAPPAVLWCWLNYDDSVGFP